jgi:hypothetical protein
MQAWYEAEDGKPDPFVRALEGSVPNENINGDGYWTGIGVNPSTGQPIGIDPRDAHFITSRICGICGDNHCTCSCLNPNMVYGVKPPPLGDYGFNLAESADFMFDHAIYNGCMANVDYSEQLVKKTNPGLLKRAEETSGAALRHPRPQHDRRHHAGAERVHRQLLPDTVRRAGCTSSR